MIYTTRSALAAVALCFMAACDRPSATGPETGSAATSDAARQTLRGIVRHGSDEWELELGAGAVVQLSGAIDQLAAFEGKEAIVSGMMREGILVVDSCQPPRSTDAEYSRR